MLGNFGVIVDELKDLGARIKAKPDAMFGTVSSVAGNTAQVVIDGDAAATPCALFCACGVGDRVTVLRKGISCVAVAVDGGDGPSVPLPITQGGSGQTGTSTDTTISNIITAGTGITITEAHYCTWGKVAMLMVGLKRSTAISAGGAITIGSVKSGHRPVTDAGGSSNTLNAWLSTGGNLTARNITGSQIAAKTAIYISFTYLLP